MAKVKAEKAVPSILTVDDELDRIIQEKQLGNLVLYASECQDLEVASFLTGFPQFDMLVNPKKPGLPRGRHIHMWSKVGSVGKSTLAAQIIAAAQRLSFMKAGLADAEMTMTESFLNDRGVVTVKDQVSGVSALRWLREKVRGTLPAEVYFDTIEALADVLDLWVVDSVAALEKKANLSKSAAENNEMAGISKLLSEYFRKNLSRNSTVLWINQTRDNIGGFSPSPGGPPPKPTGGKALNFYSSLNLELDRVESVKSGDEIVGFKTKVTLKKNKVGYADSSVILTHLYGKGFSSEYDYLQMAMQLGVVIKKGGWFKYENTNIQGEMSFVEAMRMNPELRAGIVSSVDGEDVFEVTEEPSEDISELLETA